MNIDEKSFTYLSGLVQNTMGIKMPPEKKTADGNPTHKKNKSIKP